MYKELSDKKLITPVDYMLGFAKGELNPVSYKILTISCFIQFCYTNAHVHIKSHSLYQPNGSRRLKITFKRLFISFKNLSTNCCGGSYNHNSSRQEADVKLKEELIKSTNNLQQKFMAVRTRKNI